MLGWEKEQAIEKLGEYGVKRMLEDIKETLAFMGVEFDLWVSEKSLHQRACGKGHKALGREGLYIHPRWCPLVQEFKLWR